MAGLSDIEKGRVGRGMNYRSIFSALSGKVSYIDGIPRINQSLSIIFGTNMGEVSMLPVVGSKILNMVFEPNDDVLKEKIEAYIRNNIEKLEPRIILEEIEVVPDDNNVNITIWYILRGSNEEGRFDYGITREGKGDI